MPKINRIIFYVLFIFVLTGCGTNQPNIDVLKIEFCPKCYDKIITKINITPVQSLSKSITENDLKEKIAPILDTKIEECLTKLGYEITHNDDNQCEDGKLSAKITYWNVDKNKTPHESYVTIIFELLDKNNDKIWGYESRVNNSITSNPSTQLPYWSSQWNGSIFTVISLVDFVVWANPYIHNALTDEDKELLSLAVNGVQLAMISLPYGPKNANYKSDKDYVVKQLF